jgi:hypothetical protein
VLSRSSVPNFKFRIANDSFRTADFTRLVSVQVHQTGYSQLF